MTGIAGGRTKAPISAHPLFPAVVALWFAALLGLGSLVLPVMLLEKAVALSGLDALVFAAQPPLGLTARALIAFAAAGAGVILGLVIARRVVSAQAVERARPEVERTSDEGKRPISALRELGVSRLDDPVDPQNAPAEVETSPMVGDPAEPPQSADDEEPACDFFERARRGSPAPDRPEPHDELDLGAFLEPDDEPQPVEISAGAAIGGLSCEAEENAPAFGRQAFVPLPDQSFEDAVVATEVEDFAGAAEPVFEETSTAEPASPSPEPAPVECQSPAAEAGDGARPLNELGLVELVERFALSLQRRTTALAETEQGEPSGMLELPRLREDDAPLVVAFGDAPIPDALRPLVFDDEPEDEEDEDALFGSRSLSPATLPLDPEGEPDRPVEETAAANENRDAAPVATAAQDADETENESAGYSSLLAMKRPLKAPRGFAPHDGDEGASAPLAVFPGQRGPAAPASDGPSRDPISQPPRPMWGGGQFDGTAPAQSPGLDELSERRPVPPAEADAGETERVLRAALEKLQKMSGAA